MATGLTGTEIANDLADRHRSLGAFGKPAWQSHVPLRALIHQRLGERCANFFATPQFDVESGRLRWMTDVSGPVRRWPDIEPKERAIRAFEVEEIRTKLLMLEQELARVGSSDSTGAASFASLLQQARCVPAHEEFLYLVGDQPVVAFWGFETRDPPQGNTLDETSQAETKLQSPTNLGTRVRHAVFPGSPPIEASPPEQLRTDGVATGRASPPVLSQGASETPKHPTHEVKGTPTALDRPGWLRFLPALLAFAVLLLLAILVLTQLRGCDFRDHLIGISRLGDSARPSDSALPERSGSGVDRTDRGPIANDSPTVSNSQGTPGTPRDSSISPADSAADAQARDSHGADSHSPPGKGSNLGDSPNDPSPPSSAPSQPSTPTAQAPVDAPVTPPPNPAAPASKPNQKPTLMLPKGAPSLAFLEGNWVADQSLVDRTTRQPLDLSMQFDDRGRGTLRLQRPDGSSCEGEIRAARTRTGLTMEARQALPCTTGGSFESPLIECRTLLDGQTECIGRNADGSRFGMDVRRQ